jgi:Xaa-Pro dipeptidase
MLSRRTLFAAGAGALAFPAAAAAAADLPPPRPLPESARPITADERRARIDKAQRLMVEQKIGALLIESGSSLDYFTGVQWSRSERPTVAVIPARGPIVMVTPFFEEPSVRETLMVGDDVRPWQEHESPYDRMAGVLKDRKVTGPVAVETTTRWFIVDGLRRAARCEIVSGDPVVRACRMIKSPAELALMQAAADVTMAAYRWVYPRVQAGMTSADIAGLMNRATAALGAEPLFALVLLNEASAYPHGSRQPQAVKEGGVVLMDCGAQVHGYESDISRTWVHGEASARQRKVWDTVRKGQEIAHATARVGVPAGQVDDAVRAFYEKQGWGPGYRLPGLSHRTGHGIGMDGHEPVNLVHGETVTLKPGMCFSNEPGLYIPGEFGVRMEDCFHMTEAGPVLFSGLARSIDAPI